MQPEPVDVVQSSGDGDGAVREQLVLALNAAGLGIWRWDRRNDHVDWDERMEQLFGLPQGQFGGTFEAFAAALHPDDRPAVLSTVEAALENRSAYETEHRVLLADGTVRWVHGAGRITVDGNGEPTGAIGCCRDVTEQVQAREVLQSAVDASERLAEAERINRQRLETLTRVNDRLTSADTPAAVMKTVSAAVVPDLADWCVVFLLPEDGGRVPTIEMAYRDAELRSHIADHVARLQWDPDADFGMAAVLRSGVASHVFELSPDTVEEEQLPADRAALIDRLGVRSVLSVPLVKRGEVLGGIQFVMSESSRQYGPEDVTLAEAISTRVAAAIANRRLVVQQHRVATTLQRSLLPDHLPVLPGASVAVRYLAAGDGVEVGGDFYDLFANGSDRWVAVIGDVCGKGPVAAAQTALARHTIRSAAWHGDSPTQTLEHLNHAMCEGARHTFLTAAVAELRVQGQDLEVVLALGGHPQPVLVTSSGESRSVGRLGTLLGVLRDVAVTPERFLLKAGDTLVLYTDGVTDVPPPHALSEEDVTAMIADAVDGADDADGIADRFQERFQTHLAARDRSDDIAVLVIHRRRS